MSKFLFVGGPRHGQEMDVPADRWEWLVPVPGDGTIVYIRRRYANAVTEQIRSLFAPSTMSSTDAEMALFRLLAARWVSEDPDGSTE